MKKITIPLILVTALATTACGSATKDKSNTAASTSHAAINVLYAGSMTSTMEQTIAPSLKRDKGLTVKGMGAGSSELAHLIQSGAQKPDVFISASPSVNTQILMGAKNHNLVNWYLTVARDQLVIAYSPKSRFAADLDAAKAGTKPWYDVVQEKGFQFGRTDPKLDPKGASTLVMMSLASKYYKEPNLSSSILGSVENSAQVFPEETLLARLTTGQMDAVVAYKHEAVEWGMPYITLPNAINLGDPNEAKLYATAKVNLGNGTVAKGAPIVFTATIPTTAEHKQDAETFVQYLLQGKGHSLLMKDGFTSIPVYVGGTKSAVPSSLEGLIQGNWNG